MLRKNYQNSWKLLPPKTAITPKNYQFLSYHP